MTLFNMIANSKNLKLRKLITQISDLSHISPDILTVGVTVVGHMAALAPQH